MHHCTLNGLEAPTLRTLHVRLFQKSLGDEFLELLTRLFAKFPSIRKFDLIAILPISALPPPGPGLSYLAPPQHQVFALLRAAETAGVERVRLGTRVIATEFPSLRVSQLYEWRVQF